MASLPRVHRSLLPTEMKCGCMGGLEYVWAVAYRDQHTCTDPTAEDHSGLRYRCSHGVIAAEIVIHAEHLAFRGLLQCLLTSFKGSIT